MIILYIFLSIFIVFVSRYLFLKAFGDISLTKYMPHTHLWLWQLVVLSLIGSNLMVMGIRGPVISSFITDEISYLYALLGVYYTILIIPISIIIFNYIFRFRIDKHLRVYLKKGIEYNSIELSVYMKPFFIAMAGVSIFAVVYLCYYDAPLFMFLTGRLNRVLISRVAYTRDFKGSMIIKNVIGQSIIPLASYITYVYHKSTKQKFWRNIFIIHVLCAAFIKGASMSKSGFAWYFLPFIFMITIMDGKIPLKKIAKVLLIIIPIPLYMYTVQYTQSSLTLKDIILNFYGGPIGRILVVQIQSLPSYFEIFPRLQDFLLGKSISLFNYLGLPFIESARVVAGFLEPVGVAEGWVGVANTLFLGDAYANFGLIGLLFSPIWIAFMYSIFYSRLIRKPKTPLSIGFYAFVLDNLTSSVTGGFFSSYVINTRIIAAMIFMAIIKLYAYVVDYNKRSHGLYTKVQMSSRVDHIK